MPIVKMIKKEKKVIFDILCNIRAFLLNVCFNRKSDIYEKTRCFRENFALHINPSYTS